MSGASDIWRFVCDPMVGFQERFSLEAAAVCTIFHGGGELGRLHRSFEFVLQTTRQNLHKNVVILCSETLGEV